MFLTYFRERGETTSGCAPKTEHELAISRYRANQARTGEAVAQEIRATGGEATAHEIDLSVPHKVVELFDACERELGAVDVLVNNHTYCAPDTFDPAQVTTAGLGVHLVAAEDVDTNSTVNTRSYVLMMTEFLRRLVARGGNWGRIINLSTDAAHAHVANISYAASKHAIESYSRSAAVELGHYSITINIVAPGPIQTGYLTPDEERAVAAATPLGSVGAPDDLADVIVFLASNQARWLTGQLLYVGGGWRIHR